MSTHKKDSEDIRKEWLQANEKVCICKGIPRKRFIAAMEAGALSLQKINRAVGSGSGDCKGERCGPSIEKLLGEYLAAVKK
jgi:bacterioferritin-associated ferredoxin